MIARMWHGVTKEADADAYLEYLQETGVREYASTEGNLGVQVLRTIADGRAEFITYTLWDSWDAVRRFAGDDVETPVYYPEDERYLLEFEPKVVHYEVMVNWLGDLPL